MFGQKYQNEYGTFLAKKLMKDDTGLNIVYLHDFYFSPEIHDSFCEKLKFFNYYAPYIPYGRKTEYDEELDEQKINLNYYLRYIKDMILSLNSEYIFLIAEGISAAIALILSRLLKNVVKKIVLVNPLNSNISVDEIHNITNLPCNLDEAYQLLTKILGEKSPLLRRGKESNIVVQFMRMVKYNYSDLTDFTTDLSLPKTLETFKVYEKNNSSPMLLIISDKNNFIRPNEIMNAYKNKPNIQIARINNDYGEPIIENKETYFKVIMSFLIDGVGLNDDKHLPNKEIYKYLSNEWKQYYRYQFADKLSERDKKEYLEKIAEYEKEINNNIENNPYDEETTNQIVDQQIESINQIYKHVDKTYKETKIFNKTQKLNDIPDIVIDYKYQPNKIYQNSQGYYVYHDGKGNGYYNSNGNWRKIVNK